MQTISEKTTMCETCKKSENDCICCSDCLLPIDSEDRVIDGKCQCHICQECKCLLEDCECKEEDS